MTENSETRQEEQTASDSESVSLPELIVCEHCGTARVEPQLTGPNGAIIPGVIAKCLALWGHGLLSAVSVETSPCSLVRKSGLEQEQEGFLCVDMTVTRGTLVQMSFADQTAGLLLSRVAEQVLRWVDNECRKVAEAGGKENDAEEQTGEQAEEQTEGKADS